MRNSIPSTPWLDLVPRRLLMGGVIGGLLLYSLAIGALFGTGRTTVALGMIALPLGVLGLLFTLARFELLLVALPISALAMRPVALPAGNGSELPISMLIVLGLSGIWILAMITRRQWQLVPTPLNRPLLALMAVMIISMPWGILWADPILNWRIMGNFRMTQTASLLSMLALMSAPLLIGRFITQTWQIKFYLASFIICGTLMTAAQSLGISQPLLTDQGLWGLWYALPLGAIIAIQPGVALRWRLLGGGLLLWHLWLVVIRNSLWLSGWLPTLIGLVAMVFLTSRRAFAVLMVVLVLVTAVGPGRGYLEQVTSDNIEEGGLGRLEIWARSLSIVQQHWLLGTGPGGYAAYNMTYFRDDARSTHNNYFDILAQFGVVGLGLWLWFVAVSLWYGWRTIALAPPGLLRTTAIVATAGWAAAQAAMMLGDWVLPFVYNQGVGGFKYTVYSWIFLGLLVSVRQLSEAVSAPAPATTAELTGEAMHHGMGDPPPQPHTSPPRTGGW